MRTVSALLVLASAILKAQTSPLEFDVATIKPSDPNALNRTMRTLPDGTLQVSNMSLKQLIAFSHNIREAQILGGPPWLGNDRFDIQAKHEQTGPPLDMKTVTSAQMRELERQSNERLLSLLSSRFQLILKSESREMPVYALVVAKGGSKLQPATKTDLRSQGLSVNRGTATATSSDMGSVARVLANQVEKPVLDKTGLTGRFDWKLEWTPDPPPGSAASEISGPSIFTAVQEQLGLKLESQKSMMPVLIIERAEKPSAN